MTVSDVFAKIVAHMVKGMMLHDQMADYYDFLGLMGFKRMHEYHFLHETVEMRGMSRYYINHYNKLVPSNSVEDPRALPMSWYNYERQDVDNKTKKNAVESGITTWCKWERDTKKMYQDCYCTLCDMGEVAAACKVKELIRDVDEELKCADRLHIKMQSTDYDLCTIYLMQDDMHEKYREKEKGMGVNIC